MLCYNFVVKLHAYGFINKVPFNQRSVKDMIYAEENNQMEVYYERNFNETVIGSWCTFWSPDKKMEP